MPKLRPRSKISDARSARPLYRPTFSHLVGLFSFWPVSFWPSYLGERKKTYSKLWPTAYALSMCMRLLGWPIFVSPVYA